MMMKPSFAPKKNVVFCSSAWCYGCRLSGQNETYNRKLEIIRSYTDYVN